MKRMNIIMVILALLATHGAFAAGTSVDKDKSTAKDIEREKKDASLSKRGNKDSVEAQNAKKSADTSKSELLKQANKAQADLDKLPLDQRLKASKQSNLQAVSETTAARDQVVKESINTISEFSKQVRANSGELAKAHLDSLNTSVLKLKNLQNLKYSTRTLGILAEMATATMKADGGAGTRMTTASGAELLAAAARALSGGALKSRAEEKLDSKGVFEQMTLEQFKATYVTRINELRSTMLEKAKAGEVNSNARRIELERISNGYIEIMNRTAELTESGKGLSLREALYLASKEYAEKNKLDADAVFRCVSSPQA